MKKLETKKELIIKPKDKRISKCIIYVLLCGIYWLLIDIFNQHVVLEEFTLFNYLNIESLMFNAIWMGIFTLILYVLNVRIRRWVGLIFNVLIAAIAVTNYFMYSYFNSIFSWKDLILSGECAIFISSIFKFINFKLIIFVITCILLNIAIFITANFKLYKFKSFQTVAIGIICLMLTGTYVYNTSRLSKTTDGWIATEVLNNRANYYTNWIEPELLINICGTYQYLTRDLFVSFFYKADIDEAKNVIEEYIEENNVNYTEEEILQYNGIFKDKNLIFVMMESMDDWLISKEVTPTISYMMEHGFNFVNHYSPPYVTGTTASTEFVANTGIYPNIGQMSPHYAYTNNTYSYSIASLFKKVGYMANSFHKSPTVVYNREVMHKALGYDEYYDSIKLNISKKYDEFDTAIITNGYDKIVSDNKFMSSIITFTPHSPYSFTENKCMKHLEDIKKLELASSLSEEEISALSAARETDNMFKMLLENLNRDKKLKDTVIVAFSDHPNYLRLEDGETEKLNKTLFFIYSEDMDENIVNTLTSTINILPTVTNLFGLDKEILYPGYDALNTDEEYVVFKDYTYYNGKEVLPLTTQLEENLIYSKSLLVSDYYKTN